MITPAQIISQLQNELPMHGTSFHSNIVPSSAVAASGILTFTLADHALAVGHKIYGTNSLIRNKITAVSLTSDTTLRFTTEFVHDLTAAMTSRITRNFPAGESVEVENLQIYQLDQTAASVPASNMFETIPGFVSAPTLSGNEFLLENRPLGVNGFFTITAVTASTFSVDLTENTDSPSVPDGPIIVGTLVTSIRVALVPDVQRAIDIYTKQTSPLTWLFLIMTDREASKDRENTDDLTSLPGSKLRILNIIQQFDTLIIVPTDNTLSGTEAIELVYVTIFQNLLKSLYGWENVGFESDGVAFGAQGYNTAYYAHSFTWFVRDQIDFEDGWENTSTVAFRILDFTQTINDEGESNAIIELQD